MKIQKCLEIYMPTAQYSIVKEDYDTLVFHDETIKPSLDQFLEWSKSIEIDEEQEKQKLEKIEKCKICYGDIYEAFDKLVKHLKIDIFQNP